MRDSNDFRDEVYRRAAKQRKRERRQLSAVVGCVALLLVTGIGGSALLSLPTKSDGAEVNKHNMEFTKDSIYDITYGGSIKYDDFFEIEPSEDTMPSVFIFDNYDEALEFFTQKTGEDETRFRNLGYTNDFFISSDAVFVTHYGYADSGYYVAAVNWEKEARIVLYEARLVDASDMKYLLLHSKVEKNNGIPYVLYHYLSYWDELPYDGIPLY